MSVAGPIEDDIPRVIRERFHDVHGELQKVIGNQNELRFALEEVVRPALMRHEQDMREDRKRADENYARVGSDVSKVRDDLAAFRTEMSREIASTREQLTKGTNDATAALSSQITGATVSQSSAVTRMLWAVVLAIGVILLNIVLTAAGVIN